MTSIPLNRIHAALLEHTPLTSGSEEACRLSHPPSLSVSLVDVLAVNLPLLFLLVPIPIVINWSTPLAASCISRICTFLTGD